MNTGGDMNINDDGIKFIVGFEGFVPHVYDDLDPKKKEWDGKSKPKGTLTIGYGHTNAASDPLKITKGLKITKEKALQVLKNDLSESEKIVKSSIKVPLTQAQYNALVSRVYNTGKLGKNLIAAVNRKDAKGIAAALAKPVTSKGKVLRGLERRRNAEVGLWTGQKPKPSGGGGPKKGGGGGPKKGGGGGPKKGGGGGPKKGGGGGGGRPSGGGGGRPSGGGGGRSGGGGGGRGRR